MNESLESVYESMLKEELGLPNPNPQTPPAHVDVKAEAFNHLEALKNLLQSKQGITNGGYWATVASKLERVSQEIQSIM